MRRLKIRKVSIVSFNGLIDFEMPLWCDIFSLVFTYLDTFDLNKILRSSKALLQLVKDRAVFSEVFVCSIFNNNGYEMMEQFYFSRLRLYGFKGGQPRHNHPIFRQRFLRELCLLPGYFGFFDLRIFLRKDQVGRELFPNLKRIAIKFKFATKDAKDFRLWEFLSACPRPLDFKPDFYLTGSLLEKVVACGRYDRLVARFDEIGAFPLEEMSMLKDLKTRSFIFDDIESSSYSYNDLVQFSSHLSQNDRIEEFGISLFGSPRFGTITTRFEHFVDMFVAKDRFRGVKTFLLLPIRSPEPLNVHFENIIRVFQKDSLKEIHICFSECTGIEFQRLANTKNNNVVLDSFKEFCRNSRHWKFRLSPWNYHRKVMCIYHHERCCE